MWRAATPGTLRAMHSPFSPKLLVAALASAATLAVPAAANATVTASSNGQTITVTGTDGPETIDIHFFEGAVSLDGPVAAGAGCTQDEWTKSVDCPATPGGVTVAMGGGDDAIHSYMTDAPSQPYIRADLGAGNDFMEGYGSEVVKGGPGNDRLSGLSGDDDLDGGDGNDTIQGDAGADVLHGGNGDDSLASDPMEHDAPDVIDGGPGRDSITDWMRGDPATEQLVTVTQDGAADDGFPGEGDNVTNMELVESYGSLRYVGTDGDDIATASEVGNRAELTGKGGNDTLKGTDSDDAIDGGPGADTLTGGYGNDTIVGGPGPDKIVGDRDGRCNELHCDLSPGSASDTIDALDGEADTVSCGPGQDTVKADPQDTVAPDCETVARGAAAGGAAPGARPGTTTPGTTTPGAKGTNNGGGTTKTTKKLALPAGASLRALLSKGGLTVTVSQRRPRAKTTITVKRGAKVIAKGSAKADAHGIAKVKVRVTTSGRRALRHARSAKLTFAAGADRVALTLRR